MWLNDIRSGRYGDAIPQLKQIRAIAASTYGINPGDETDLAVRVSDAAYPDSIADLTRALHEWERLEPAGARLGFLDPMRYRVCDRESGETSSEDHRRWLAQLGSEQLTLAVHFTGHSHHPLLEEEMRSLHEDALAVGYAVSRTFQRQHYAVFFASRSPVLNQAEQVANEVEVHVQRAWRSWCQAFTTLSNSALKVYRGGIAAG